MDLQHLFSTVSFTLTLRRRFPTFSRNKLMRPSLAHLKSERGLLFRRKIERRKGMEDCSPFVKIFPFFGSRFFPQFFPLLPPPRFRNIGKSSPFFFLIVTISRATKVYAYKVAERGREQRRGKFNNLPLLSLSLLLGDILGVTKESNNAAAKRGTPFFPQREAEASAAIIWGPDPIKEEE